jgi:hypothetical protein
MPPDSIWAEIQSKIKNNKEARRSICPGAVHATADPAVCIPQHPTAQLVRCYRTSTVRDPAAFVSAAVEATGTRASDADWQDADLLAAVAAVQGISRPIRGGRWSACRVMSQGCITYQHHAGSYAV